jgi:hypothetical protein
MLLVACPSVAVSAIDRAVFTSLAPGVENLPPVEFQVGFVKRLPAECTDDRHLVTVGRDPDGLYHWEERPGPEPADEDQGNRPPFRVVLVSPEEYPAPGAYPRVTSSFENHTYARMG